MIFNGKRRNGLPIHIQNGSSSKLQRIPLNGRDFNEEWIQKLIAAHPSLLPVNEIENSFSPLISIGREISTPVGYLDNLFVSPDGYITIVEAKLWRNPGARREVVGQIIDYAKELSKWTFTDLDNAVIASNQIYNKSTEGILQLVKKSAELDEADEKNFIDNISRNLKRGRFLLLIVGDGIRESVEDMIEYLSQSPQLHFTLALVELQVFKMNSSDDSLIVIPQLVTRTKEITRAIVRLEGNYNADLKVSIETDLGLETDNNKISSRYTITAEDYFEHLLQNTSKEMLAFAKQIIKDAEKMGYYIEWNSGSFGVRLLDPQGSGSKITLFTVDKYGKLYLGFTQGQMKKLGIPIELSHHLAKNTAELFPSIVQNPKTLNSWSKYASLSELHPVYPQFMEEIRKYVENINIALQEESEKDDLEF